jgi:hypothetical protein
MYATLVRVRNMFSELVLELMQAEANRKVPPCTTRSLKSSQKYRKLLHCKCVVLLR